LIRAQGIARPILPLKDWEMSFTIASKGTDGVLGGIKSVKKTI
jgi:hypothetical protein